MYLLLPLELSNTHGEGSWRINWTGINACASLAELLKEKFYLGAKHQNDCGGNMSSYRTSSCETECKDMDKIHLANCSEDAKCLKNMVVLAIHTGKIYSIVEVVSNTSAESPFDGNADDKGSKYSTYKNYFNKK